MRQLDLILDAVFITVVQLETVSTVQLEGVIVMLSA